MVRRHTSLSNPSHLRGIKLCPSRTKLRSAQRPGWCDHHKYEQTFSRSGTGLSLEGPVPESISCGQRALPASYTHGDRSLPARDRSPRAELSGLSQTFFLLAGCVYGTSPCMRDWTPRANIPRRAFCHIFSLRGPDLWNTKSGVGCVRRFRRPGPEPLFGVCDDFAARWLSQLVDYTARQLERAVACATIRRRGSVA
uniref:Uncharacterized protein n=1 Tax=Ananas comosus var. bracteatus TaxID=296719 RepID=A0A6V7NEY9_ANACO|nr:unnamed protein product [Ananas comosus var. bracteatus]